MVLDVGPADSGDRLAQHRLEHPVFDRGKTPENASRMRAVGDERQSHLQLRSVLGSALAIP
jgi:hypothetical protein